MNKIEDIPDPIIKLTFNNPLLHRLLMEFKADHIVTKEEFYCQCIIGLSKDWKKMEREYLYVIGMFGPSIPPI